MKSNKQSLLRHQGSNAMNRQLQFTFLLCFIWLTLCLLYNSKNPPEKRMMQIDESGTFTRFGSKGYGYILATCYTDQMTWSNGALISLQCYASTLGPRVRVVEPFVRHSSLGVYLYPTKPTHSTFSNEARLSDLYDKKTWDSFQVPRGFAPLTSWDHFIKYAPRKLIVVKHDEELIEFPGPTDSKRFFEHVPRFAKKYGFETVRNVSVPNKEFSESEYKDLVYGGHSPSEVVVLYRTWGGIDKSYAEFRQVIKGNMVDKCYRKMFNIKIPFGSRIIQDGEQYISKYFHGKSYISVMLRIEYFMINRNRFEGKTTKDILSTTEQCFSEILRRVSEYRAQYGLDSILMTMDCRKQGSKVFINPTMAQQTVINATYGLFHKLYGNSMTLEEWDESFESIASFRAPGYIALLQKHLAAKGDCLLTAGGGSFQSTAHSFYDEYHSRGTKCKRKVTQC